MAKKKKTYKQPSWKVVVFGAIVFVGLGLALITSFKAGANAQLRHLKQTEAMRVNR